MQLDEDESAANFSSDLTALSFVTNHQKQKPYNSFKALTRKTLQVIFSDCFLFVEIKAKTVHKPIFDAQCVLFSILISQINQKESSIPCLLFDFVSFFFVVWKNYK